MNKLLADDIVLIWMKQALIWLNLQKDGTSRKFAATNISSAPTYVYFPVFNAGLSSSYDGWAKCKEKVPGVSDPNQNIETRSNSKLKFI